MIVCQIELTPCSGKRGELLQLLRFCADQVRTVRGCVEAEVYEAGSGAAGILYLEKWESDREFSRHVQSNLYRGVLAAIDLAEGPRKIEFYEVAKTRSLDWIEALRGVSSGETRSVRE